MPVNENLPQKGGEVAILNVGDGDTKLSFDPKNPAERIRAARIVADMIRRGYALLVEVDDGNGGKHYTRALSFNEEVCEYIIADFDPVAAARHDEQEAQDGQQQDGAREEPAAPGTTTATGKRTYTRRAVKAESAKAVSVARVSGG